MKAVEPIDIDHERLYRTCVSQTQNEENRDLLLALTARVVAAGARYIATAEAGQIHTLKPIVVQNEERTELKNVYKARLGSTTGICRSTYHDLKVISTRCPYCGFGEIYELDHFLPQGRFPELNIFPRNLLPICHPCNHIKMENLPEGPGRLFLHPYFDRLPDIRWLFAEIYFEDGGPVLRYRVILDEAQYGMLAQRLGYHFSELQLDRRMAEQAAQVLVELEADIDDYLSTLGTEGMKDHFREAGERSFRLHGNILDTAAYFAASENEQYCSGMYKN